MNIAGHMQDTLRHLGRAAVNTATHPRRYALHYGLEAASLAARPGRYVVRRSFHAADAAIGAAFTLAGTIIALVPAAPAGAVLTLAAAAIAVLPSMKAKGALSITQATANQQRSPTTKGVELSGITWAGGDLYYAVDDADTNLYAVTISVSRDNGTITANSVGNGVHVSGVYDMEGCAFDPLTGNVWVSCEYNANKGKDALIFEIDPATGRNLRSAPVPSIYKNCYGNFSLEALTISGDGLTMWTCNEEALSVDGEKSSQDAGSVVRLQKFTRANGLENWKPDGQWAYLTEPVGTIPLIYNNDTKTRCGVASLTALPDGSLLTLERRCYNGSTYTNSTSARFVNFIYKVDFDGATDTSNIASLKNADYTRVKKTLLHTFSHSSTMRNYEGMCLGPRLNISNTSSLILIADGGSYAYKTVSSFKLSGLNIASLTTTSTGGTLSPGPGPFRYLSGTNLTASISDVDYPSAYTNNTASITNVLWTFDNATFGYGNSASLTLTGDHTLNWLFNSSNTSSPIDDADSFETYAAGASAADGEVGAWTGDGEVMAFTYDTPASPGYPMPKDSHTQVLDIDGSVARAYANTTNGNDRIDLMLQVTRRQPDSQVPSIPDGTKLAIQCATNGVLELYCRDAAGALGWVSLDDGRSFAQGEWIRISIALDSTTVPGEEFALLRVNGKAFETASGFHAPDAPTPGGAWYRTAAGSADGRISSLSFNGTTKIDDVIKTTEAWTPERAAAADGETYVDGIPLSWLEANGYGDEPQALADATANPNLRALGYTAADIFDSGIDPEADEPFQVTSISINDENKLELTFNGVREDLGNAARDALYPVLRRSRLSDPEEAVGGTTSYTLSPRETRWVSDDPVADEQGFYRVHVEPQR